MRSSIKILSMPGFWAMFISLAVHAGMIAFSAFYNFTPNPGRIENSDISEIRLRQISRLARISPVMPKPDVLALDVDTDQAFNPETLIDDARVEQANEEQLLLSAGGMELFEDYSFDNDRRSANFFQSTAESKTICYVVDSSGSMKGFFKSVRAELIASINSLAQDQYFYIIFFQGGNLLESGHGKLLRASRANIADAQRFIKKVSPSGRTDALAALSRTFEIRDYRGRAPEQIFFLTDGLDLDKGTNSGFVEQILRLASEKAPRSRINCIGFWVEPTDADTLSVMAEKTNGTFSSISN